MDEPKVTETETLEKRIPLPITMTGPYSRGRDGAIRRDSQKTRGLKKKQIRKNKLSKQKSL